MQALHFRQARGVNFCAGYCCSQQERRVIARSVFSAAEFLRGRHGVLQIRAPSSARSVWECFCVLQVNTAVSCRVFCGADILPVEAGMVPSGGTNCGHKRC